MGCGGSRLNADGEWVPARIRPAFPRRIEEIIRRRHADSTKESTSSKKVLLLPNNGKADDIHDHESEESLKKPEPAAKSIKKHNKDCHGQEDEEEEGGLYREDGIGFPGSPSFRVYFTDNLHIKDDDDHADHYGNEDGAKSDQQKYDATANTPSPNHCTSIKEQTEEPVAEKESGERKRGGLMLAIQRGGQSSFKSLFNVRSCYSPSSYNRPQPLTGKPIA